MTAYAPFTPIPGFVPGSAQSPAQAPAVSQGQSRLGYFITRNNGLPVPLIPADELPFTVKLQHVPRVLTPDQTYGLHYVGSAPYTGVTFQLERDACGPSMQRSNSQPPNDSTHMHTRSQSSNVPAKQFLAPDALARQAYTSGSCNTTSSPSGLSKRPVSSGIEAKSWRRSDPAPMSDDPTQSVIDAILNSSSGTETAERIGYTRPRDATPPPSGVVPDQERKQYCTYWILKGDCAYVQQGCRYKHEMPDKAKLTEIGIHHVPRWWQEQNAAVRIGASGGFGGERKIVGEITKPEVWMSARRASDADSEGSSATDASEESVSRSGKEDAKENIPPKVILKRTAGPRIAKIPSAPPSSPAKKEMRKPSVASDLIDFAPLLPTPSPSTTSSSSTLASTPPSSTEPPKRTIDRRTKPSTTKVFVPAGESPRVHIADAKKRAAVAHVRASSPRTASPPQAQAARPTQAVPIEQAIQNMQKAKVNGLSASRHAPITSAPNNVDAKDASQETDSAKDAAKRHPRSMCRPRRPASYSPAAGDKK